MHLGWKNLGFRFLGFSVERRPNTILWPTKNILYTILPVTRFCENYNKNHKSRLTHENRYDLYKTAQKMKNLKPKISTFWVFSFLGLLKPKNLSFSKQFSSPGMHVSTIKLRNSQQYKSGKSRVQQSVRQTVYTVQSTLKPVHLDSLC